MPFKMPASQPKRLRSFSARLAAERGLPYAFASHFAPAMLLQAIEEFPVDLARSLMVGDKDGDVEAGRRAGVGCCILIPSNNLGAVPLPRAA